jgi:hypothetical protein
MSEPINAIMVKRLERGNFFIRDLLESTECSTGTCKVEGLKRPGRRGFTDARIKPV